MRKRLQKPFSYSRRKPPLLSTNYLPPTSLSPRDGDSSGTAALITLRSDNLIIMLSTQTHPMLCPSVEMAASSDSPANASTWVPLWVSDGPELLEGLGTVDARSVDTSCLEDVVGCTVTGDGTFEACGR